MHRRLSDENLATLRAWRDLLWAEAIAAYEAWRGGDAREEWWLTEAEDREREVLSREHTVEDYAWTERIARYLEAPNRAAKEITTGDVLTLVIGLPIDRIDRGQETRAGKALRALGWVRVYRPGHSVVTVVTDESEARSPMSLLSLPSQLIIDSTEKGFTTPPPNSGDFDGRDVTPYSTTEYYSEVVSHHGPDVVTPMVGSDGYPASWDEVRE